VYPSLQEVQPYDTVVLKPGMYKRRVLCNVPVKLISEVGHLHGTCSSAIHGGMPLAAPLSGDSVIFWQERPPALLSNADTLCLSGVTVRVMHSSHEYSSIAYGPNARSIVLDSCHVMGGTGLRIPYSIDPLRVLQLNMKRCVVQVRCFPGLLVPRESDCKRDLLQGTFRDGKRLPPDCLQHLCRM
jgi:hypothetical protein